MRILKSSRDSSCGRQAAGTDLNSQLSHRSKHPLGQWGGEPLLTKRKLHSMDSGRRVGRPKPLLTLAFSSWGLHHCYSFPHSYVRCVATPSGSPTSKTGSHVPWPVLGAEGLRLLLLSGGCCSPALSSFSVSYPSPDLKFINANPS